MNRATLLVDGHRILPELLRDLSSARSTIHISIFLFFRDPIGEEIAALLARKAAEGVKVRVLLNVEKTNMGDPFSTAEKGSPMLVFSTLSRTRTFTPSAALRASSAAISSPIGSRKKRKMEMWMVLRAEDKSRSNSGKIRWPSTSSVARFIET